MEPLHQGDILKIEKIKHPVLVASQDFFNTSGEIIGCPIIENSMPGPLHIWISTQNAEGYVQCEKLALLDLSIRGHKKNRQITNFRNHEYIGCYSRHF